MKQINKLSFILFALLVLMFSSCEPEVTLPILTTTEVTDITNNSAISGGKITSDGGGEITARGVCWSLNENPTISDNKTIDGLGTGRFTSTISGLTESTTYFVRAYATNASGTGYGEIYQIQTALPATGTIVYDGFTYNYITIGTQTWMVQNLQNTHYRNGDSIAEVTNNLEWRDLTTGAWCDFNNSISNGTKYGKLYNFYSVEDSRNIAPIGWHVPTKNEWQTLSSYVQTHFGYSLSGGKALAAKTDWTLESLHSDVVGMNLELNNSTGFSALPGGYRSYYYNGQFGLNDTNGYWWSSTLDGLNDAIYASLSTSDNYMGWSEPSTKANGFSVRCVRD